MKDSNHKYDCLGETKALRSTITLNKVDRSNEGWANPNRTAKWMFNEKIETQLLIAGLFISGSVYWV